MDAIDKYDPDFIYTDGTSTQPFSGAGTGTGLKADAMETVIAHFYNQSLKRVAKYDFMQKKAAEAKAAELSTGGKSPHFVQKCKEEIET
jgi:hypothetical protein